MIYNSSVNFYCVPFKYLVFLRYIFLVELKWATCYLIFWIVLLSFLFIISWQKCRYSAYLYLDFNYLCIEKKSKNIPLYLWRGHALCQFQNFDNSLMALMDLKEWLVNNVMSCQIVLNSSYRNTVVSTSTS